MYITIGIIVKASVILTQIVFENVTKTYGHAKYFMAFSSHSTSADFIPFNILKKS